jgi:lauroyl/myristoyl acyltransferase
MDEAIMKFTTVWDLYILFVIALIKAVNGVSSPKLKEFVIKSIAFSAYRLSKNKRRLTEKNLLQAFGGQLSEEQKRRIVEGTFYEFWQDTFSLLPSDAERDAIKEIKLQGVEHLQRAIKDGKGVILWESNSFCRRNLAKQILHENRFSIHQVHGEHHFRSFLNDGNSSTWVRHHIINAFFEKCERQFVADITYLPSSDSLTFTRDLLNLLKQNAILVIPGDGQVGKKLISIKFFGRSDLFSTGIVSLAKISSAPVLPMFCVKDRNDRTCLIIEQPIHIERHADRERGLEESIAQYVILLESYIKKYPEQYQKWRLLDESTHKDHERH